MRHAFAHAQQAQAREVVQVGDFGVLRKAGYLVLQAAVGLGLVNGGAASRFLHQGLNFFPFRRGVGVCAALLGMGAAQELFKFGAYQIAVRLQLGKKCGRIGQPQAARDPVDIGGGFGQGVGLHIV